MLVCEGESYSEAFLWEELVSALFEIGFMLYNIIEYYIEQKKIIIPWNNY